MKKSGMKRLLGVVSAVVLMVVCGACNNGKNEIKEYTVNMSDEAKQIRDALFEEGGAYYFREEYFAATWESVMRQDPQPIPSVETENPMDIEKFMERDIYTITGENTENIVLYIHGGAWVYQIDTVHFTFCDSLATALNAKVYLPIYDLAPSATYQDTIDFVENFYKELLSQGKDIYVMGDSAGGTIALDLMYALKEDKVKMPERLVLLAPCCDLSFSNPEMEEIEERDPMLAIYGCRKFAELWAGGEENLKNPAVSALYADLSGYPETMIVQGTDDILYADNRKLCEKMHEAGVEVSFITGEGLFHVFAAGDIPEKDEVIEILRDFCK